MKYIRTIYGHIYETTGQDKNHPRYYNIANANLKTDALGIVMQADTIEELCDEFVFDGMLGKLGTKEFYNHYYHISIEQVLKNKQSIYGAIWTDKGLIYVAKMNDKGELELL